MPAERPKSDLPAADVRMRGFARRKTVDAVLDWLDGQLLPLPEERVQLSAGAGRVLSQSVTSQVDVPGFDRSMMDGYAVQANATSGASSYNPIELKLLAAIWPGRGGDQAVAAGQAAPIMTGAPLPAGADAVLPVEQTETTPAGLTLLAQGEVSPGKHVGRRGEDIQAGTIVLPAGRRLRPQDVGLLSSIGVAQLPVIRQPRVRILLTGNELLPAGTVPRDYRVSDANGPMLSALVARDGGCLAACELIPDQPEEILVAMQQPADVVLVSGGSSVGQEDHAPRLVAEHGELSIHGIAMRPSSPAGIGRVAGQLVFLLPGNPVSCLCAYDFFAGRAIRALGGRTRDWPYPHRRLPLLRKLVSAVGRVDYARVQVTEQGVEPLAIGGASVLSSTTRADGFVIVPGDSEGYAAGTDIDVYLYDA